MEILFGASVEKILKLKSLVNEVYEAEQNVFHPAFSSKICKFFGWYHCSIKKNEMHSQYVNISVSKENGLNRAWDSTSIFVGRNNNYLDKRDTFVVALLEIDSCIRMKFVTK